MDIELTITSNGTSTVYTVSNLTSNRLTLTGNIAPDKCSARANNFDGYFGYLFNGILEWQKDSRNFLE